MRHFLFFIFLLIPLCILSCIKSDVDSKLNVVNITSQASLGTKSTSGYSVSSFDVREYLSRQEANKEIVSIEPIVRNETVIAYLVSYDKGWDMFSADKRIVPIIANSADGCFDMSIISKTGLSVWLQDLAEYTSFIRTSNNYDSRNIDVWNGTLSERTLPDSTLIINDNNPSLNNRDPLYTWTKTIVSETTEYQYHYATYPPLLETTWGQGYPWNENIEINDTTRAVGCVAVALGQLLYYYHYKIGYPSGLYHDVSITDFTFYNPENQTPYYTTTLSRGNYTSNSTRWDDMPLYHYQPAHNSAYVSDLLLDIGNRANMKYRCNDKSDTSTENAHNTLYSFQLASTLSYGFPQGGGLNEIIAERPFYIDGDDIIHQEGHAWVIDGAQLSRYKTTTTYCWTLGYLPGNPIGGIPATQEEANAAAEAGGYEKPESGMISIEITYSPNLVDYHMNWGWNGTGDDYYLNIGEIFGYSYSSNIHTISNIHYYAAN